MKNVSSDTLAVLATRNFLKCDLYSFFPSNIPAVYYTSADIDITSNGQTFKCGGATGLLIDRSSATGGNRALCNWKTGLEAGTLQFDVIPRSEQFNGQAFLVACRKGFFDGAEFSLDRYVSSAALGKSGSIPMFQGRVAEIDIGRTVATFMITDHRELLNIQMPRNLYASACRWSFCDSGCSLNRTDFTTTASAASGSSKTQINTSGLSDATGTYDQGAITFTSGINNGLSRTVKTYTHGSPSTVTMIAPFPDDPAPGDTFSILMGCDKTQSTCLNKFSNLTNFGGTPFIPSASAAS